MINSARLIDSGSLATTGITRPRGLKTVPRPHLDGPKTVNCVMCRVYTWCGSEVTIVRGYRVHLGRVYQGSLDRPVQASLDRPVQPSLALASPSPGPALDLALDLALDQPWI